MRPFCSIRALPGVVDVAIGARLVQPISDSASQSSYFLEELRCIWDCPDKPRQCRQRFDSLGLPKLVYEGVLLLDTLERLVKVSKALHLDLSSLPMPLAAVMDFGGNEGGMGEAVRRTYVLGAGVTCHCRGTCWRLAADVGTPPTFC